MSKKWCLLFLIIACTSVETQCKQNSDCAPATCCHPTDAVPKEKAPDCSDTFCTQECVPLTIDCGQGEIACVQGKCQASIY